MPNKGTDQTRKIAVICNSPDNAQHIGGIRGVGCDPSTARRRYGQHSCSLVGSKPDAPLNGAGVRQKVEKLEAGYVLDPGNYYDSKRRWGGPPGRRGSVPSMCRI